MEAFLQTADKEQGEIPFLTHCETRPGYYKLRAVI